MVSRVVDPVAQTDDMAGQPAQGSAAQASRLSHITQSGHEADAVDLAAGQIVIISARWIMVLAGLIFALWNPASLGEVRLQIGILLVLAVANFFLHGHVLMRRPVPETVVYGASAVDVLAITLLLSSQGGIESGLYIYYFPAVMAFSVAFPALMTMAMGGAVLGLYSLISLASAETNQDIQQLVIRLIMLAAIAFCGHLYWRIERRRRQAAAESVAALLASARRPAGQH